MTFCERKGFVIQYAMLLIVDTNKEENNVDAMVPCPTFCWLVHDRFLITAVTMLLNFKFEI